MGSIHFSKKSPSWNSPGQTEKLLAVFSESEHGRYFQLSAQRQIEYLQSRCLLRHALSKQFDLPFEHWHLLERPDHSPMFVNDGLELFISLSHSKHYLACAISASPIGIDIDEPRAIPKLDKIVNRVFTPKQQAELIAANTADREALFLSFWSQKEAVFKACTDAGKPIQFMSQGSAVGTGFASAHASTQRVYGAIASQENFDAFSVHCWRNPQQCRQLALRFDQNSN